MNKIKLFTPMLAGTFFFCLCLVPQVHAEKTGVWNYHTHAAYAQVYPETLQALSLAKFTIKQSNQDQGTIYALRGCWVGSCDYGSVLLIFTKGTDGVGIQATFTERSISLAPGPHSWGKALGKELKKNIPDLTIESAKQ